MRLNVCSLKFYPPFTFLQQRQDKCYQSTNIICAEDMVFVALCFALGVFPPIKVVCRSCTKHNYWGLLKSFHLKNLQTNFSILRSKIYFLQFTRNQVMQWLTGECWVLENIQLLDELPRETLPSQWWGLWINLTHEYSSTLTAANGRLKNRNVTLTKGPFRLKIRQNSDF